MGVICKNCGGAHPVWDCSRPTKPVEKQVEAEPANLPPPSKAKRGRPKTDFDKAEYNRSYMRDLRKAKPLGLKVSEYRRSKET